MVEPKLNINCSNTSRSRASNLDSRVEQGSFHIVLISLYRLDQKNRELVGETEGLMEEIRLLNQDLAERDGRIDKLNQVYYVLSKFSFIHV